MSKIDMKRDIDKRLRSKLNRKHWRDHRLREADSMLISMFEAELEKQLEFAESRCGTLKQQLDYIKVLYGSGERLQENEVSGPFIKEDGSVGIKRISFDDLSRWNNSIGDFPDGENAEKCFLPQAVSYTNTTGASTNSSNKPISSKSSFEKKEIISEQKGPSQQPSRVKLTKAKRKKAGNLKRKVKNGGTEPRFNNAFSQTLWPIWQDPVVEIYKNTAANIESESAADICYRNKRQKLDNQKSELIKTFSGKSKRFNNCNEDLIPATKLKAFTSFKSLDKIHTLKEESVQTESVPENEPHNKSENCALERQISEKISYEPEIVKNYCQPTISSKKKRVERNFLANLNNLNLKSIPFIAATSTAPSHNIGVNIQQVLSIIKKRQPSANNPLILSDNVVSEISGRLALGSRMTVNDQEASRGDLDPDLPQVDSKKLLEGCKSNTSRGKLSEKELSFKMKSQEDVAEENENPDWMCKVQKLKKVLVFLHEDFTSLSQKYKRLQRKLSKRNINKIDAKGELAEIERDLEKKEEEITTVIGLYKEVLHLREEVKKYQDKYNLIICERALMLDGIKQSNSTHTQMSTLLRKIQQFQDQLKR